MDVFLWSSRKHIRGVQRASNEEQRLICTPQFKWVAYLLYLVPELSVEQDMLHMHFK